MEFIKSQKNKNLLKYNGYLYRFDKKYKNTMYWRCTEELCKSRLNLKNDEIVKGPSEHNHTISNLEFEKRVCINEIKIRALSSQDNPHQIVSEASTLCSQAVHGALPPVSYIKRTVCRIRQINSSAPSNPFTITDITIPDKYSQTIDGRTFLINDIEPVESRILVFATKENLDLLSKSDHWFADGTFKSCPPLFTQVYTIHVIKHNLVIPVVFALMPDKTQSSYERLFSAIKTHNINLNPKTIMTDFEQSSLNAFKIQFPNTEQNGCFFHQTQCVWRKIQTISGMVDKYKADSEFSLQVRYLSALAFVPENDVIDAFETLCESTYYTNNEDVLEPLISYFEDTWIGRPNRRRRRNPRFPISLWNCFRSTISGLPRTNNYVEGWHRGFNNLLSSCHPTIWKFIEAIQKQQSLNEMKINQYIAGTVEPSRKRKRDTLTELVNDYYNRDRLEYLRGVAYNLKYQI
ncbi:uncharacterized protein LOC111027331 [Myzus persicae]|uniref:uncharacterized protein LOC111027331 n=2 Tax=Myzus persicae TaxID=13164 RepID=UPI000B933143|nr:uncharacterized protein LOC111027331 [Myzus persicae]